MKKQSIKVTKSDFIAFAYTVKTLGTTDVTEADYAPFFEKLSHFKIQVEYKVGEKDKCGKLHYHGILYLPKGFFRKRIMCQKFHIKLVELYDKKGWMKYIHKDCAYHHLEEQAEEMEQSEQGYMSEDSLISVPDDGFKMPKTKLF